MRTSQKAVVAASVLLAGTVIAGSFFDTAQVPPSVQDKQSFDKPAFEKPDIVKAIYLTSWSAATPNMVDYALELARTTEINAVVLDIKDWSGYIFYDTGVPEAETYGAEKMRIRDIQGLLKRFHQEDVYVIARIVVFQDPVLAEARPDLAIHRVSDSASLWQDNSGLAWIDPAA
ncbi:MAG: putative glycoside hydrolase, partial [bacterium]|nr:putative glycoside hydrolase [bacterium]